jgi:cytochrome c oxidase subunit 2
MSRALPLQRRTLLAASATGMATALAGLLTQALAADAAPREIEIVAQRFRYTPDRIALQAGERVVLLVRSLDFMHGFSVPDLGLRADLAPGRITRIELQARGPGTLDFLCDNFCGEGHEEMHGQFIVS